MCLKTVPTALTDTRSEQNMFNIQKTETHLKINFFKLECKQLFSIIFQFELPCHWGSEN